MKWLAVALLATFLSGCSIVSTPYEETEQGRYTQECKTRGGFVSKESEGWNTIYNCPGAVPPLPELVRS